MQATLAKQTTVLDFGHVTYEIHLHPTYRVPCLWFTLHNLPPDEPAFNIDTVFRRLVPDEYKDGLRRGIGGIGGISADVSIRSCVLCQFTCSQAGEAAGSTNGLS